jgi:hypothetical protein
MKKYVKIFSAVILLAFFSSCNEENDIIFVPDATLIWTGDYNVDGCGFFVETHGNIYKPENETIIPPEYSKVDSLSITVQFIDLSYEIDYYCGDLENKQSVRAIKLLYMDPNELLPD